MIGTLISQVEKLVERAAGRKQLERTIQDGLSEVSECINHYTTAEFYKELRNLETLGRIIRESSHGSYPSENFYKEIRVIRIFLRKKLGLYGTSATGQRSEYPIAIVRQWQMTEDQCRSSVSELIAEFI